MGLERQPSISLTGEADNCDRSVWKNRSFREDVIQKVWVAISFLTRIPKGLSRNI